jgi:hypothetical protein
MDYALDVSDLPQALACCFDGLGPAEVLRGEPEGSGQPRSFDPQGRGEGRPTFGEAHDETVALAAVA